MASARQGRVGISFPLQDQDLRAQEGFVRELEALGVSDVWASEAQDLDAFVPLALVSQWAPRLRLGIAILPVQTRGPALLAMSVAALAQAAPGRCAIGLGSSSEWVVSMQNARPFEKPLQTTRDVLRFLRSALHDENPSRDYETFSVRGFKLRRKLASPPPILLAALRPGMLDLAGREADGAILNYVTPEDVAKSAAVVRRHGADKEIAARLYMCPTGDAEKVRAIARYSLAPYLSVPTYRRHQEWLGNERYFEAMWQRWGEGDIRGARAALSDEACDRLYVHGSADFCRARLQEYFDAGLDTAIIGLLEEAMDPLEAVRLLAPG